MVLTPWRGPNYPGELPTLGWQVLDRIAEYLIVQGGPAAGEPALCLAEALGPVVPDGWDADGEPVGRERIALGSRPRSRPSR